MKSKEDTALRSRLSRGLGAQGYSQAVQVVIRLVEVPLLLGYWGAQLYGEWLMVAAIPAYLSICDGGFAGAASREMSIRSGAGDRPGALSVFQSTWILLLIVSAVLGLLALLAAETMPLRGWLGFKEMGPGTFKLVVLILIVHVLVGFQVGLLYGGFYCDGRYSTGMALVATTQVMEFGGLAFGAASGGGPVAAASGYLGGRLAGIVLMRLGLRRANPWLRYGLSAATAGEVKRLAAPAFASLAFPLGNAFNIQGMQLVIGMAIGPPSVVLFTALRTLSRFATQPISVINRLIEPEMAAAYGGNRKEVFRSLFSRSCQVAIWLSTICCIALGVSGEWVLRLWTGGGIAMDWPLFSLLLGSAAVNATWYTALMVVYATNRHAKLAVIYSAIYGVGAFCVAYGMVRVAGLAGVGTALLLAEIAMAAYVLPETLRLAGESWASLMSKVAHPPWFLFAGAKETND